MWAGEVSFHLAGMIVAVIGVVLFVQTAKQRLEKLSCYICWDHIILHQSEHHTFIADLAEKKKKLSEPFLSKESSSLSCIMCKKRQSCTGCFIKDYIIGLFLKTKDL